MVVKPALDTPRLKGVTFTCGRNGCPEQNWRNPKEKVDKGSSKAGELGGGWRRGSQSPLVETLEGHTAQGLEEEEEERTTEKPLVNSYNLSLNSMETLGKNFHHNLLKMFKSNIRQSKENKPW